MESNSRNYTIDIFRLIASLFIVFLHVGYDNINENITAIIRISGRWGVPFFFLLSGYFFQRRLLNSASETVKRTCLKLFLIMINVNVLYILFQYLIEGRFNWKHIIPGTYFHLWFLPSLILGTFSVYLFHYYKTKLFYIIAISVTILCLVLFTDSYSPIFNLTKQNLGGKVIPLLSIPFMNFGAYFSKIDWRKKINSPKYGIMLIFFGFLIQLIEIKLINVYSGRPISDHQYIVGTGLLSLGVFLTAFSIKLKNETLGKWGKDYSLFIYLYHPALVLLFSQINYHIVFVGNFIILYPLMIFLLTLGIGLLLNNFAHPIFQVFTGSYVNEKFQKLKR